MAADAPTPETFMREALRLASEQRLELPPNVYIHANWESRPGIPGRLGMARRIADRLGA